MSHKGEARNVRRQVYSVVVDSRTDAYDRGRITEEPCAAKVARTVLKTSGRGDPLAEFNRALRFGVQWRKRSLGTASDKGDRWVERLLSLKATCRLHARATYAVLVDAVSSFFQGHQPDLAWITERVSTSAHPL